MAAGSARQNVAGAAGTIEVATQVPDSTRAVAVIAHPHPLFGGSMDNKVVTTLAKAFVESGAATYRFNFRGVGNTQGAHDEGRGETDDMLRVIEHARSEWKSLPLLIAGFSFGGAVATRASVRGRLRPARARGARVPPLHRARLRRKRPIRTTPILGRLDGTPRRTRS